MKRGRADEMPQWVKVITAKSNDPGCTLGTQMGEGESRFPQIVLWCARVICVQTPGSNKWIKCNEKKGTLSNPHHSKFLEIYVYALHKQDWNNEGILENHMPQNATLNFENSFHQHGLGFLEEDSGRKMWLEMVLGREERSVLFEKGSHFIQERQQ